MRYSLCALLIVFSVSSGVAQQAYLGQQAELKPENCENDPENWSQTALERIKSPPLGLPKVTLPADNPPTAEKIELGRKLFFDRRLSINGTMSCAMCHVPEQSFVDWELKTAVGVEGRSLKRNTPTLINVAYMSPLFHDGRDFDLETQIIGPLLADNEMANPSIGLVLHQIRSFDDYKPLFKGAFGGQATVDRIGQAIASYERSLIAGNSPFDRWYYGKDETALSDAAKRGFALFDGKAGCSSCHLIEEDHALFTDMAFHNTGFGQMREDARQNPPASIRVEVAPGDFRELDFKLVHSVSGIQQADLGRYEVTQDPDDRWLFRTPSLRNLKMTPPYMHDGFFSTIDDVIAFYDKGGYPESGQDPRIKPLGLQPAEKQDIVQFLESLTSDGLECLTAEARHRRPDNF